MVTKKTTKVSSKTVKARSKPAKTKKVSGKTSKASTKLAKNKNIAVKKAPKSLPKSKTNISIKNKKSSATAPAKKVAALGPMGIKPYELKKGDKYMGDQQQNHFKQILNVWKKQLMQEVDRTIYDLQEVTVYSDPVDRASQEEEFNLKLRERDRERKLLKKIDEALARIKSGDYGYCDECGAEIGIRRLEARPTATQCIECKTIAEIREKQIGG